MRRLIVILVACLLTTTLVGCIESDADAYDRDGFKQVKDYTEKIIPATDDMVANAEDWLEEQSDENIKKVIETANDVKGVNDDLFKFGDNEKYDKKEVESWTIDLSLEEGEWVIEGDELYETLSKVESNSNQLVEEILEIKKSENNKEQLNVAIEKASESINVLRDMFKK